ncbi:MAG: iron ABC transporter permease [Propionibacteriaceae bacterium]|jgi:thiamine transport system permease protein|nr:iron ABC transporter permease [Propionibacteriaceae bacterium]
MSRYQRSGAGATTTRPGSLWAAASFKPVWAIAALIPLAFLAVFFVWPVLALVTRGFYDSESWTLTNVAEVLGSARTWRIIRQTLTLAVLGTLGSLALGVPGAYVLYRLSFRGQKLLRAIATVPFVLPSVVVGVAFRSLLADSGPLGFLKLDGTLVAVVAALVFFNYSVVVRSVGVLWAGLDPRQVEAAATLGAPPPRAFLTVTLPALAPAIASAAALVFLFCASAFGVVLILGGSRTGTVETEIWYQTTALLNLPAAAALSIVQLVIVVASLWLSNTARARQERALRLAGSPKQLPITKTGIPAICCTALTVAGLLLAPLLTLVWRSLQTRTGLGFGNYALLATNANGNLSVSVWRAAANSLVTGVVAMLLAVVLGGCVSFVLSRTPVSRWGRTLLRFTDSVFMLPLGVSAVTVGFGFLITLNRPPLDLRTSWILIPIAQAIVALPLVVRTLLPTWRAIDPRLREAAATLGASPGRVLATVELPLLSRGLGLAVGFAFATSLGEFGATSFLARPDRPTLPVVVYKLISRPGVDNLGMALAAAVVLALATAIVMALAELLGRGEERGW